MTPLRPNRISEVMDCTYGLRDPRIPRHLRRNAARFIYRKWSDEPCPSSEPPAVAAPKR
jgi:hypothetical protein